MGADYLQISVPACGIDEERLKVLHRIVDAQTEVPADVNWWDDLPEWKECLHEAVDFLADAGDRRDTGVIGHEIVTGGMSRGDGPTEAFQYMDRLNECCPIIEQMEAWREEDTLSGPLRINSMHVMTVTVIDPDAGGQVELEIRKLETGALIGFDGSYLAQLAEGEHPQSPYDEDAVVIIPENETVGDL